MSIVHVLIQFVFRLTFGVALAMMLTPSRLVSSGFFRVHLWVLMGLNTMAALAMSTQRDIFERTTGGFAGLLTTSIALSLLSYFGSVMWLYELSRAGKAFLAAISVGGFLGGLMLMPRFDSAAASNFSWLILDVATSGGLLGAILTAMFLGHWYLNTPTMDLRPLKRLVILIAITIVGRAIVTGAGLCFHMDVAGTMTRSFWIFLSLRWIAGLLAAAVLMVMTWYSLKIPNTQSATGILYASVILAFIGELTSQFLSASASYPL